MTSGPPPDDAEGRTTPRGFGVSLTFGGPSVRVELEGGELVADGGPQRGGPLPQRAPLRLLHGGLDDGPVPDVPGAPMDEPPGG